MSRPTPNPRSGAIDCPASMTFGELVDAVRDTDWSLDGVHPEPAESTLAELLARRQPRPIHWGCGLLASQCCELSAVTRKGSPYVAVGAPRRASGPDLRYLFIGGEGCFGHIERARFALVRGAARYLRGRGHFGSWAELFTVSQELALLDPRGLRRIEAPSRTVEVYLPLRGDLRSPLRATLAAAGLEVDDTDAPPRAARLAPPVPAAPWIGISAAYPRLETLLEGPVESAELADAQVELLYPDAHGALLRLSGSDQKTAEALLALVRDVIGSGDFDAVLSSESELFADPGEVGIAPAYAGTEPNGGP